MKNERVETFDIPVSKETFGELMSLKKESIRVSFGDMETALRNRVKALPKAGA